MNDMIIMQNFSSALRVALAPSLLPGSWRSEQEINLTEKAEFSPVEKFDGGFFYGGDGNPRKYGGAMTFVSSGQAARPLPVKFTIPELTTFTPCEGKEKAIAAVEKFSSVLWVKCRAKVVQEREVARVAAMAIKKAMTEKLLALREKMRMASAATQSVWVASAQGLRARMVKWVEGKGGALKRAVKELPGIAGSRVLVAKLKERANEAWRDLREGFLSLENCAG